MMEKTKRVGGKIEKAAVTALLLLCICIFSGLTYYSARYTMVSSTVDTQDSPGMNLLVPAVITATALLLHRLLQNNRLQPIREFVFAQRLRIIKVVSIYVYIISLFWILNSHVAPGGDGSPLCHVAHRMILGNYVDMERQGYMTIFPHQFSLLSVIHLIFYLFGVWKYDVFQQLNALCMPLLFYSGCKILQLVSDRLETILYYILFFLGCLPLFLYTPFVYGEIISITFTMVLMWQIIQYCKTGRKICFLYGTAAIVLACLVRKNSWIILIAAAVVLLVNSIVKANFWGILWLLLMALSVSGSDQLIHTYYEKASGIEVSDGVPYISWIRMGMQDSSTGPGWFDNSSIEAYTEHDYDAKQTVLAEKKRLGKILTDMWADKAYCIDFFRRKILSQWNSPEYYCIEETRYFDCQPEDLPVLVKRIYCYDEPAVHSYMNRYQFALYFYATVSSVILFIKRKEGRLLAEYILYIAIIGGFLFSALWEARSRYVLPYAVYMIPLAAWGMQLMTDFLAAKVVRLPCIFLITGTKKQGKMKKNEKFPY